MSNIRNFCIIAHIDHGKSTLADRFLEITGTIPKREMRAQFLDQLDLERERGITIKMAPVRMHWRPSRGLTLINADSRGLLYEELTYKIRGALFKIYNSLGSGHKEGVYQNSLELEFTKAGLVFEREKRIDVIYDGKKVGLYQPDFVVDGRVVVELKVLPFLGDSPKKQARYYLRGSEYKLALLVNFGAKNLEVERIIYDSIRENPLKNPRTSASSEYILNLIDTPGHSDFSYEVSRALAAVQGAVLLVDASQGIQAQTLANLKSARAAGLTIIGAINKIDLFQGEEKRLELLREHISVTLGIDKKLIFFVSGKTGEGVEQLLEAIIERIPSPYPHESVCDQHGLVSRALIFDSFYDNHKGVVASVRVFSGEIKRDDTIHLVGTNARSKVKEVGYFNPKLLPNPVLSAGEIGYIATGIKDPSKIRIGDTVIANLHKYGANFTNKISGIRDKFVNIRDLALPGYKEPKPVVFVSFYPEESDDFNTLKNGLEKLKLNDSALSIYPDQNEVLGRGFKVGFLGKLHFEIVAERLKREFGASTLNTFPSVLYKVKTRRDWIEITKPEDLPKEYDEIWEPMVRAEIIIPSAHLKNLIPLQSFFRMKDIGTSTLAQASGGILNEQIQASVIMPLAELISDFDDKLKSVTEGYASFSYESLGYEKADVKKVDLLIAGRIIPGLSRFFPKENFERESRKTVQKLKDLLPRQQFAQALQAVSEGRVIAREDIPALRKDVTGYLYGGDRTRKMKLWKKQARGKKRLKERAEAKISAGIFKELLRR